jgi:hypothetical protein
MQVKFAVKFAVPFAILAAGLVWAKERVGSTCEAAGALGRNLPRAAAWLAEAEHDPFLARRLNRPHLRSILQQMQAAAAIARSDFGLLRLDSAAKHQLAALAEARNPALLARAAAGFDTRSLLARCPVSPSPREQAFVRQLEAAEADWRAVKQEVAAEKIDFASDRAIYCQLDQLHGELERVMHAAEERCRAQAGKTACAAGSTRALRSELRDLEEKRDFNLGKLQRKWPAGAVEGIQCRSVSI